MIGESRFVGAALIPALIKKEKSNDVARVIERRGLYQELEDIKESNVIGPNSAQPNTLLNDKK